MPIPDFQGIMRPLLVLTASKSEITLRDAIVDLGDEFGLSPEERTEMLPSGFQGKFTNRVAWAATHLQKAGALTRVGRGRYRITDRGQTLLGSTPGPITIAALNSFPEYQAFKSGSSKVAAQRVTLAPDGGATPDEAIEARVAQLTSEVALDLLERVRAVPPDFFEQLVVDVLVAMGYGGSRADAGRAIGRSGDGGIDGVIKEDRLGLDAVYVQAKRWEKPVGRPDVQQFSGSLDGQKATKGVFFTTSTFTGEARDFVRSIGKRIVLVDGIELAHLMIEHQVGVEVLATFKVYRVDSGYFEPEP